MPARPTVPCAGCATMRRVSGSPSASLAARAMRHRGVVRRSWPSGWPPRRAVGVAVSLSARCGRCSSRPGSRARSSWLPKALTACGRRARATARCRGSRCRGRRGRRRRCPRPRRGGRTQAWPTGCMPCGPPVTVAGERAVAGGCTRRASPRGPAGASCWRLSLRCALGILGVGRAVAGLALQAAVAGREAVQRVAGRRRVRRWWRRSVDRLRARRRGVEHRRVADLRRCCAWRCRCGSSGRSARRASRCAVGAPTSLIVPWQLWHCMASVPSAATAAPMAPRRQRVVEPGWQR